MEEKVDGANSAVSFGPAGELRLQSRGHYLTGGRGEVQFDLFKKWAHAHADVLRRKLRDRYVMFGDWLFAKHTLYYDDLPHLFIEFDLLDTVGMEFLDTPRRKELGKGLPVVSAPVLYEGRLQSMQELVGLLGQSHYIREGNVEALRKECSARGVEFERVLASTDVTLLMEGLYVKVEEGGVVRERAKFVRDDFQSRFDDDVRWTPIVRNRLRAGVDIFAPAP